LKFYKTLQKNKGDAVPQGENTHKFRDISERSEKKDDTEKEEEMIVSGEHMRCPQGHVSEIAACQHAFLVGLRNSMAEGL